MYCLFEFHYHESFEEDELEVNDFQNFPNIDSENVNSLEQLALTSVIRNAISLKNLPESLQKRLGEDTLHCMVP